MWGRVSRSSCPFEQGGHPGPLLKKASGRSPLLRTAYGPLGKAVGWVALQPGSCSRQRTARGGACAVLPSLQPLRILSCITSFSLLLEISLNPPKQRGPCPHPQPALHRCWGSADILPLQGASPQASNSHIYSLPSYQIHGSFPCQRFGG